MDLFENPLTRYTLYAVSALLLAALLYLVFIAARALLREARGIARAAGHPQGSATLRAVLRMVAWAAWFGVFYSVRLPRREAAGLVGGAAGAGGLCRHDLEPAARRPPADRAAGQSTPAGRASPSRVMGMLGLLAAGIVLAIRA